MSGRVHGFFIRHEDLGFRVQDSGSRVWGLGFWVEGLQGVRFEVKDLGFRV